MLDFTKSNTIQYNKIQYNTFQYNTIQCNAMQYRLGPLAVSMSCFFMAATSRADALSSTLHFAASASLALALRCSTECGIVGHGRVGLVYIDEVLGNRAPSFLIRHNSYLSVGTQSSFFTNHADDIDRHARNTCT